MTVSAQLSALDHHFAEFINGLDSNSCDELWLAAALTSAAAGRGHVCLVLAEAAETEIIPFKHSRMPLRTPAAGQWLEALVSCNTVGRPGDYTPLVLDEAGRLYLNRSWQYERRVANDILSRLASLPFDHGSIKTGLERYFPPTTEMPDLQRVAAAAAATRRFIVISGGPGTGKTATVARILALLIEQAGDRELVIALAAPTGKAALRMRQAIRQATGQLELPEAVRNRMPDKVQTIHRLLGVLSGSNTFRHHRDNPLSCDLLVVDEVSMIDLPLMAHLLEALNEDTRIILLGDRDQLASVEAGAVLSDICNHGVQQPFSPEFRQLVEELCGPLPIETDSAAPNAPIPLPSFPLKGEEPASHSCQTAVSLSDSIIHLKTSYRFGAESGIGNLSRLINAGESAAALDLLQSGRHDDLFWRPLPESNGFEAAFTEEIRKQYNHYAHAGTPTAALEELDRFRVLSPLREGLYGVNNLNRLTMAGLGMRQLPEQPWCPHLPVMVTGNNYELGLFNGDTAVLLNDPASGSLAAFFPDPDGGLRRLSPLRLPPFDPAFALTVHKSQGSEFERVLLVLPGLQSELLSRELLYTAVTRGRKRVEIWGTEEVFRHAVARRTERCSGLRDRLWGAQ